MSVLPSVAELLLCVSCTAGSRYTAEVIFKWNGRLLSRMMGRVETRGREWVTESRKRRRRRKIPDLQENLTRRGAEGAWNNGRHAVTCEGKMTF